LIMMNIVQAPSFFSTILARDVDDAARDTPVFVVWRS